MNRTIWKYSFDTTDKFIKNLPKGAEILTVQTQGGVPCMWAKVDPEAETEARVFRVFGTGHPMNETVSKLKYIGTYQELGGGLIFHLFEEEFLK